MIAILLTNVGPYHWSRIQALAKHGPVGVVAFRQFDRGLAYRTEDSVARIRVHNARDREALISWLETRTPDAVLVPGWREPLALAALGWCRARGVPAVLMTDSTAEDRRRRKLVESVKGAVVRLFDAALVSGGAARGYLRQLGFTGPVSDGLDVVDNKHFIEGSNAAWRGPRSARKKYRLPERYFLMVGKLEAGKDQRTALSAAAQAFDAGLPSTFRFLLAGEGTCRGELEAHSRDLGIRDRVKFLGPVAYEDLPSLYAMATALILPSRSETWGLVVNESLACGTPVIVSRVCGCAGDLVHRGRTGLTFEPGDAEALSRAMVAVARSPKRRRVWASDCRRLVARWGPERFAAGAVAAVKNARARRRSALSPFERGFLRILSGLLDGMAWKRVAPR